MNPTDSQTKQRDTDLLRTAPPPATEALAAKEAAKVKVPSDDAFLQEYIFDEKLQTLATALIESCDELNFIGELGFTVIYLWKQKGGQSGGHEVLGKCVKLAGLVKYFGKADFVVWLGADNLRKRSDAIAPVIYHFAALMYHELCHIDKDDKDQPASQGHEFEGFASEVERFGIWRESMKPIARAFQESLFPEEAVSQ